ncbi:flippase-like domain-containing protein [Paenibacillus sp. N4]|uniref:lysylphosphatidylglycerol synthase transmembrane domain-containing protein n=1 Tax=Paenibacillus vietnamensis TaxID=2590547 RepID=UPI001CD17F3F|nr:lysylphosphatidylglycerol synthase transmembrane domain-containing protein [Paenibacillus vietnamensis]MCA0753551.1 flippase-like domain-containing protein [Paenibacillus vietnamensis]
MKGKSLAAYGGLGLLIIFLMLSWQLFDLHLLVEQLRGMLAEPGWLFFMFVVYLLSFVLKAAAWQAYAGREHPFGLYLHGIFYSLLVNHLLPIKAGDFVRAGLLMKKARMRWDTALHSVVMMRLTDLFVLGTIAAAGMLGLGMAVSWYTIAGAAAAALILGAALKLMPIRRWPFVSRHAEQFKAVAISRQGPYIFALVAASWVLEAVILYGIARMADIRLGAAASIWANSVTIGGQLFHVTPGGIGTYESTMSGTLALLGVDWEKAYATALLAHAFKFAVSFLVGAYSLLRMPIGLQEARGWLRMPRKSDLQTNQTSERIFK